MTCKLQRDSFSVVLAGQPNTGKSTVFNFLTGQNQHVGNWPGKTVEKKEGWFDSNDHLYRITDLPGTYSLSANSQEELIAREHIIFEKPDLVVAVVNAAALNRSLYLVAELITFDSPLIVVLNMMDVAKVSGRPVDTASLQEKIGVPVVPMVASGRTGFDDLKKVMENVLGSCLKKQNSPWRNYKELKEAFSEIQPLINERIPASYPLEWATMKLLEGDKKIEGLIRSSTSTAEQKIIFEKLKSYQYMGRKLIDSRYRWIQQVTHNVRPTIRDKKRSLTSRIDRWATHPVFGTLIMVGVFILTTGVVGYISIILLGEPLLKGLFTLEKWAACAMPPSVPWLAGLVQGTVRGAGGVFALVLPLSGFAAAFAFLEDIGYMARVAYLMDFLLARIGLNGRAFLPLLYGGICNILGVWGTRIIDTQRARLMTILLNPFVPCSAKTAVLVTISFMFFSPAMAICIVVVLYIFNITILCITGLMLDKTVFRRKERSELIMELPLYHRPNMKTIWDATRPRITGFIVKVGTVAIPLCMAIWWLCYFPSGEINTSYMARCGKFLDPVGHLMGLDWRMVTALLASMLNKEATMATIATILGAESGVLHEVLQTVVSPSGVIAFLTAQMLFTPCVWTIGVMYSESKSMKMVSGMMAYMILISFGAGITVYQLLVFFV